MFSAVVLFFIQSLSPNLSTHRLFKFCQISFGELLVVKLLNSKSWFTKSEDSLESWQKNKLGSSILSFSDTIVSVVPGVSEIDFCSWFNWSFLLNK